MLVKAAGNRNSELPAAAQGMVRDESSNPVLSITLGRMYVVYAISVHGPRSEVRYAICDDDYEPGGFPMLYPGSLFAVAEDTIPGCWRVRYQVACEELELVQNLTLAFPEWLEEDAFHRDVVDGKKWAVALFEGRKREIDEEAVVSLTEEDRFDVLFSGRVYVAYVEQLLNLYPSLEKQLMTHRSAFGNTLRSARFMVDLLDWAWEKLESGPTSAGYGDARSMIDYVRASFSQGTQPISAFIANVAARSLRESGRDVLHSTVFLGPELSEAVEALVSARSQT